MPVHIPVLKQSVLPHREAVVRVVDKDYLHHRVAVRKEGLVAIAEVQAPYLQIDRG